MFFDWQYLLIVAVPGMILGLWAQARVHSAFARASKIPNRRGLSGAQVAQAILERSGVRDVSIEPTQGMLTDHYHPLKKALRLSSANYEGTSLAAAGIAAHEVGHAIQHARGYWPMYVRSALVPATIAGQWIGQIAMMLGAFFAFGTRSPLGKPILYAAIAGYALVFLFTLITLPVEFNASKRAMLVLADQGILAADEIPQAKLVLDAAAWTYVASAVQVLLTLVYLITRARER